MEGEKETGIRLLDLGQKLSAFGSYEVHTWVEDMLGVE